MKNNKKCKTCINHNVTCKGMEEFYSTCLLYTDKVVEYKVESLNNGELVEIYNIENVLINAKINIEHSRVFNRLSKVITEIKVYKDDNLYYETNNLMFPYKEDDKISLMGFINELVMYIKYNDIEDFGIKNNLDGFFNNYTTLDLEIFYKNKSRDLKKQELAENQRLEELKINELSKNIQEKYNNLGYAVSFRSGEIFIIKKEHSTDEVLKDQDNRKYYDMFDCIENRENFLYKHIEKGFHNKDTILKLKKLEEETKMLKDINNNQLKVGQVVEIKGGYFKNSNGTFKITNVYDNNSCSMVRRNKNGQPSKAIGNLQFYPLVSTVSNRQKQIEANQHNEKYASIEIIIDDVTEIEKDLIEKATDKAVEQLKEDGGRYIYSNHDDILEELEFYGIDKKESMEIIKERYNNLESTKQKEKELLEQYRKEEQERKEQEKIRDKEIKEDYNLVVENVDIVDLENEVIIENVKFANHNKNNNLTTYIKEVEKRDYTVNDVKIHRIIRFKDDISYNSFCNSLLMRFEFLKESGGVDEKGYIKGILIKLDNNNQFIVNTEGFNYSRYVGLIDNPQPEEESEDLGLEVNYNEEKNGIELKFNSKPDKEVLENLKANGFRWSRFNKLWYTKDTPENRDFVKSLASGEIKEFDYPDIEIDDIESYTVDPEISKRENDSNWIFRSKETDHQKELQDTLNHYQDKTLNIINKTDNEYTIYELKKALQRFKKQYASNYINLLTNKANNPSWAVTGRAGRNLNRMNKANDRFDSLVGECIEITDNFKNRLDIIDSRIRRSKRKEENQKIINTKIEINFKTIQQDVTMTGITQNKRTYHHKNYMIVNMWGAFRVLKDNKELNNFTTLNTAKKYIQYLENKEVI